MRGVEKLLEKPRVLGDKKSILRQLGFKVTEQRLCILDVLSTSSRVHLTAQDVFDQAKKINSQIGFATVYRFLKKMSKACYLVEIKVNGLPARYEVKTKNHHDHLICLSCGKIVEFVDPQIEKKQEEIALKFKFQLENHILELYGKCEDCLESKAH